MCFCCFFFFQAEDGIRDLVRSRGLGDVYKRQRLAGAGAAPGAGAVARRRAAGHRPAHPGQPVPGLSLIHI